MCLSILYQPWSIGVLWTLFAGVAQGVVTGIRGLCNGLGPALFGLIFYLFHVDLNDQKEDVVKSDKPINKSTQILGARPGFSTKEVSIVLH